jgi:hypothetical protein
VVGPRWVVAVLAGVGFMATYFGGYLACNNRVEPSDA